MFWPSHFRSVPALVSRQTQYETFSKKNLFFSEYLFTFWEYIKQFEKERWGKQQRLWNSTFFILSKQNFWKVKFSSPSLLLTLFENVLHFLHLFKIWYLKIRLQIIDMTKNNVESFVTYEFLKSSVMLYTNVESLRGRHKPVLKVLSRRNFADEVKCRWKNNKTI